MHLLKFILTCFQVGIFSLFEKNMSQFSFQVIFQDHDGPLFISLLYYFIDDFIKSPNYFTTQNTNFKILGHDSFMNVQIFCTYYICTTRAKYAKREDSMPLNPLVLMILNVPNLEYSPSP